MPELGALRGRTGGQGPSVASRKGHTGRDALGKTVPGELRVWDWREKFRAGRGDATRVVDRETQLGGGEGTGRGPGARGERVPGAAVAREAQLAGPAGGGGGGSAPLTQAASQCLWR